jgi:ABC-type nitrate/sulfonate/bicarbonate transport system permease component
MISPVNEVQKVEVDAQIKTPKISHRSKGNLLKVLFTPFGKISSRTKTILQLSQVAVALLIIQFTNHPIIPTPTDVLTALGNLFKDTVFIDNLITTMSFIFYAMGISIFITMLISYLSKIPFFEILAVFASKCRYLTLPSLVFLFTFLTSNLSSLKSSLLVFGIVPYFTTSMLAVLDLRSQEIDKAFLNKKNAWESLYEVAIVGKLDQLFEVMRQNFAFGWAMITMVEGIAISEGGIGTMLIKSNKYLSLSPVLAMLVVILCIGLFFDFLFKFLRKLLFPYVSSL